MLLRSAYHAHVHVASLPCAQYIVGHSAGVMRMGLEELAQQQGSSGGGGGGGGGTTTKKGLARRKLQLKEMQRRYDRVYVVLEDREQLTAQFKATRGPHKATEKALAQLCRERNVTLLQSEDEAHTAFLLHSVALHEAERAALQPGGCCCCPLGRVSNVFSTVSFATVNR